MTSRPRRRRACFVGALIATSLLQACGYEAEQVKDESGPSPTDASTSAATCAKLISDEALAPLTWTGMASATADSDGCSRAAAEGSVGVVRLSVGAIGAEDLPERVEAAFTARCEELDQVSEDEVTVNPLESMPGEEVDWLAPAPTCVVASDGRTPESVLLTVTDSQALVEIRITTESPTAADKVQESLILLGRTADEVITAPRPS